MTHRLSYTLRFVGAICLGLAAFLPLSDRAHAQSQPLKLTLDRGVVEPLPISILDFFGEGGTSDPLGPQIAQVIERDLASTNVFRNVPDAAIAPLVPTFSAPPRFGDVRTLSNAAALVTGEVGSTPDGRFALRFRLWDVVAQQQIAGFQYTGDREAWRRMAHRASDAIYERLTGEPGYFETRIVFVDERGPKNQRVKRLAVMDYDGQNLEYLTGGSSLVLTPRFSPRSQEITYISYRDGLPRVYLLDIESRRQEILGRFPGMTFAPRFAPDGASVLMSLARGGNTDIYEMDLRTRQVTRLTSNSAIDTAPSYSPDGRRIVFESDRGGSQQLYVMPASGGSAKRISFGSGRYATPVWSPRGDLIAFTRISGGRFGIGVMDPDGGGERILTDSFLDESPTWAPNGRRLMFFRETQGAQGQSQLYSIDIRGGKETRVTTPGPASDPAWGPVMR
jgi:TolB protein